MNFLNALKIVIFNAFIIGIHCVPQCCPNKGIIKSSRICKDDTKIDIKCDEYPIMLNKEWGMYSNYFISSDNEGEFLDAYVAGYIIREPYFCVGLMSFAYANKTSEVAITCSSYRAWYQDLNITRTEEDQKQLNKMKIISIIFFVLNFLSFMGFMVTAAVYYFLPEAQDLQGTCYFHFTLIAGIGHGTVTYMELFDVDGLLPNMCITNAYLTVYTVLCSFLWSLVMSFNVWRQMSNCYLQDEEKLLKQYKICSYGIPCLILFAVWVQVHIDNLSNLDMTFILKCYEHEKALFSEYFQLPILIILILNFVIFVDTQKRLWNLHTIQTGERRLAIKIIKYRILMNAKLFFIMGIPWGLTIFLQLISDHIGLDWRILDSVGALIILGEGIPLFLILVPFRKRILRGIANRWFPNSKIVPEKWKNAKDSETEEENEEPNNTNYQVQYNVPKEDDKMDNISPIVTNLSA